MPIDLSPNNGKNPKPAPDRPPLKPDWDPKKGGWDPMSGPDTSNFYPGPVVLESRPMGPDDAIVRRHGPARG
ncbi:hypothetical protein ACGFX2_33115 [Streptomyces goshikiensis]|uniref:hypothetical protein n=1 Tax=Streptomyces goshikiensis TaxID=1942 RepID=UPI00371FF85A